MTKNGTKSNEYARHLLGLNILLVSSIILKDKTTIRRLFFCNNCFIMIDHRTKGINKKQSKEKFDNQLNILNMTLMDMKNTSFLDEDDINDVLLDSCNEEYTGISATLTSKKLEK